MLNGTMRVHPPMLAVAFRICRWNGGADEFVFVPCHAVFGNLDFISIRLDSIRTDMGSATAALVLIHDIHQKPTRARVLLVLVVAGGDGMTLLLLLLAVAVGTMEYLLSILRPLHVNS
jgi:hypothetical protein